MRKTRNGEKQVMRNQSISDKEDEEEEEVEEVNREIDQKEC